MERAKVKKVGKREWAHVKSEWLEQLAIMDNIAGKPEPGLDALPELIERVDELEGGNEHADLDGLRMQVLWEAIYLYRKADHVLRVAQMEGMGGRKSWSLFTSYHAAFLAAKSVLYFLGIVFPVPSGRNRMIDLFPAGVEKRSRSGISLARLRRFKVYKIRQLEHRDLWKVFVRTVRVSDVPIWEGVCREFVEGANLDSVSTLRNRFIYRANFWPYDDLTESRYDNKFGIVEAGWQESETLVDHTRLDFLMTLGMVCCRMGQRLFFDVLNELGGDVVKDMEFYGSEIWGRENRCLHSHFE